MFMQGPPDAYPGQTTAYPGLLMKIGGAVLEAEPQGHPATVLLDIFELWMIREVAKSTVVVGSERVGLNLLVKTFEGIRALTARPDMESLVSVYGEVAEDEPGKSDYAAQLERIRDGGEISSGGMQDEPIRRSSRYKHEPGSTNTNRSDDDPQAAA
jgi:hypothetical protein